MQIAVKDLPQNLKRALDAIGYRRRDIKVDAKEFEQPDQGGEGYRGVTAIVNLDTGEYRVAYGSWGGANPYEVTADRIDRIQLQPNMAVITGTQGGRNNSVFASITVHPSNMAKMLPVTSAPLSERELTILYAFRALKGGEPRQEHFRRYKVAQAEIDALEAKGLIKVNKAGAAQITTEGRNAFPRPLWSPPYSPLYGMSLGAWSPPWSR